jgi:hypothetical protein
MADSGGPLRRGPLVFCQRGVSHFDPWHTLSPDYEYRGYLYKIPDFQIPGLATDNFTHLAQPSVGWYGGSNRSAATISGHSGPIQDDGRRYNLLAGKSVLEQGAKVADCKQ